jgi:hypothetical protein
MSTATTQFLDTGQQISPRGLHRDAQQPVTQQERSAAQRLRTTMAAGRLAFTWLAVRKTLTEYPRGRLISRHASLLDGVHRARDVDANLEMLRSHFGGAG